MASPCAILKFVFFDSYFKDIRFHGWALLLLGRAFHHQVTMLLLHALQAVARAGQIADHFPGCPAQHEQNNNRKTE